MTGLTEPKTSDGYLLWTQLITENNKKEKLHLIHRQNETH